MIRKTILSIAALLPSVCFGEIIEAESELNLLKYDYNPTEKTATLIGGTARNWQLVIPDAITVDGENIPVVAIASDAFVDNEYVTSVKVGASVTKIESKAIYNCTNLKTLYLNAGSKTVELMADCFADCPLVDISIDRPIRGEGMSMSVECFANSDVLESIWIYENTDCIPSGMFANCPALYMIEIGDADTALTIDIDAWPQSNIQHVTCDRNLTLPSGSPFADSESMRHMYVGDKMTYINPGLFKGCKNAKRTWLYGKDIIEIGDEAFAGCVGLNEVRLSCPVPPVASDNTFDEVTYSNATLSVPEDAVETYKSANCWKNFAKFGDDDDSGIEDIVSDEKTPVGYYSVFGIRSDKPFEGQMNILVFSDGSAKKIKY